jgi:hypothetical protein
VTFRPRDSRIAASEAAAIPFPKEETTPPVTKTYLVIALALLEKVIITTPKRSGKISKSVIFEMNPVN